MCGIAGIFGRWQPAEEWEGQLHPMINALKHRGPDDKGIWFDEESGIGLGHRRLSIIDLSEAGKQPMFSSDRRYCVVFNGECYNYIQLRSQLSGLGHSFRGSSDTEVMLAAFLQWGVESALQRFNGMLAMAVWDRQEQTLYLIRDRVGIKPLYYGWMGQTLAFASELKALRTVPGFSASLNMQALGLYLQLGYIPAPHSVYDQVYKLRPGHLFKLRLGQRRAESAPYWDAARIAADRGLEPFSGSQTEALEELDGLLKDSVGLRMVSDVPLGAFLSGGVDSSLVVSQMQRQSSRPVRTFSIGFSDELFDEAPYAARVAQHLQTEHTEFYVSPADALKVVPELPALFDEPMSDSSQIPTFLVSRLARQHVTVCLSGDGGDELFCGYHRYQTAAKLWARSRMVPALLRPAFSAAFSHESVQGAFASLEGHLAPLRKLRLSMRLPKLAKMISAPSLLPFYSAFISQCTHPGQWVSAADPATMQRFEEAAPFPDMLSSMMFYDFLAYLPDDILVKVDRASMAVSLEARVPLLDHRMVEFAWRLPLDLKYEKGRPKRLIRLLLDRYVPRHLVERPKQGFAVPIGHWLRGPLQSWADDLLSPSRLRQEGLFEVRQVCRLWQRHLQGADNTPLLWALLMFLAWLDSGGAAPLPAARNAACLQEI